jgi:hypothetical protein
MKMSVVPAQITTVEDRIAGSLGLSQLLLFAIPIFLGSALYVVLPPYFRGAPYKAVVIGLLTCMCCILAVRLKGKLVLFWLIMLLHYGARPRYYVFDKRSLHAREQYSGKEEVVEDEPVSTEHVRKPLSVSTPELVRLQEFMLDPAANMRLETRKGDLYVHITEVKQES